MRLSFVSALALAASAFAQDVSFGTPFGTGTITQFYGVKPDGPAVATYYDTVKASKGAQLIVNSLPFRRRAIVARPGTPFTFIPTKSKFMGYESTKEIIYGHLGLVEDPTLHLTVGQFTTDTITSPGPVPYLAPAVTTDDASQISQFWSLEPTTGVLTFLNLQSGVFPILPASLAPVKPESPPEPVHLANSWNKSTGQFYFNTLTTTCPPGKVCPL